MKEEEIIEEPNLSVEQFMRMDMHSLINVISLLIAELSLLEGSKRFESSPLSLALEACYKVADAFEHGQSSSELFFQMTDMQVVVREQLNNFIILNPSITFDKQGQETLENIDSLLNVFSSRSSEILEKNAYRRSWFFHNVEDVQSHLKEFFVAVEKNSKNRYHIVFNAAEKKQDDYLVDFKFLCVDGQVLYMPLLITDVIRDLLANARKYTPRGGTIRLFIEDNGKELLIRIEDTGIGIPANEIKEVVRFGVRGSNLPVNQRQYGGGFGLTKALVITKSFGGRFWIKSGENEGTTISLRIPRPANTCSFELSGNGDISS